MPASDDDTLVNWDLASLLPLQGEHTTIADSGGQSFDATPAANSREIVRGPALGRFGRRMNGGSTITANAAYVTTVLGDWSFEAWVFLFDSGVHGIYSSYGGAGELESQNFHADLIIRNDQTVEFFWEHDTGTDRTAISTIGVVPVGEWFHLAVTRAVSGSDVTTVIYVNGAEEHNNTVTGGAPTGGDASPEIKLGASDAETLDGYLGGVRVSSVTRSAADVLAEYNRADRAMPDDASAFVYWQFQERPDLVDTGSEEIHARLITDPGVERVAAIDARADYALLAPSGTLLRSVIGELGHNETLVNHFTADDEDYTIEVWARLQDATTSLPFCAFFAAGEGAEENYIASLLFQSDNTMRVFLEQGSGTDTTVNTVATETLPKAAKYFVVTKTGNGDSTADYSFYVNGTLLETLTSQDIGEDGSEGALHLGWTSTTDTVGIWSSIRVSGKARSAAEISAEWALGQPGSSGGSGIAPTIGNFSPAAGAIVLSQSVAFDVLLTSGTIAKTIVWVELTNGSWEMVWNGDAFAPAYNSSTRVAITDGYRYTLVRSGGWPAPVDIRSFAISTVGTEAVAA